MVLFLNIAMNVSSRTSKSSLWRSCIIKKSTLEEFLVTNQKKHCLPHKLYCVTYFIASIQDRIRCVQKKTEPSKRDARKIITLVCLTNGIVLEQTLHISVVVPGSPLLDSLQNRDACLEDSQWLLLLFSPNIIDRLVSVAWILTEKKNVQKMTILLSIILHLLEVIQPSLKYDF